MDIRAKVLSNLNTNEFTMEQLVMIELAVAEAIKGLEIKEMETLPALSDNRPKIVREFLIRKQIKGCSPGTIANYENLLKFFFQWWGSPDITKIKDTDILLFLAWYENARCVCKRTLEAKRSILYSFFEYAHETGKIPSNPVETVDKIKFVPKLISPLTDEELEIVRKTAKDVRESAIIETLYATGCRVSELVGINIEDVDFDRRELIVLGKGNRERKVYLNAKAKLALQDYLKTRNDDCPALIATSRYPIKRLGKGSIEKIVKQIEQRSGIHKLLTPHVFRHTMASDMYKIERDIVPVQKALGHADPKTTLIYAEINDDRIKDTHNRSIR